MTLYNQLISDKIIGDCYRACIATLLQLPPEVLPNDFSPRWTRNWDTYLEQFGLTLSHSNNSKQPIWISSPWIAFVKSLNYEGGLHAILMHEGGIVLHDPSPKKKYKVGTSLLGKNVVVSGSHLIVTNVLKLHQLDEYRNALRKDTL